MRRPRGFQALTMSLTLGAMCCAGRGAVIHVDDDAPDDPGPGDSSISDPLEDGTPAHPFDAIQEGINAAVAGDEVLVADGLYEGTGNRDLSIFGLAITVRSVNGPDVTVIDAGGEKFVDHRAFVCNDGETPDSVIQGFRIQGGFVTVFGAAGPGQSGSVGGAVLIEASSPTFMDCRFVGNVSLTVCGAARGGAVHSDGGSPSFIGCIFLDNLAEGDSCAATTAGFGGAISGEGSDILLADCRFESNAINAASTAYGGAVWSNGGNLRIRSCVFESNQAYADDSNAAGAGVAVWSGRSTVVDRSEFRSCNADGFWGADGGGLLITSTVGTVSNCLFDGNQAHGLVRGPGSGGGMAAFGDVLIVNCTFSGNAAIGPDPEGNAISAGAATTAVNCIVWGNLGQAIADISGGATVTFSDVEGGYPGAGNLDLDPLFVNAAAGDYRLGAGSPCIDAGNNTAVPAAITEDLDGNPRFIDDPQVVDTGLGSPPIVDMGALERLPCLGDLDSDGSVGIVDLLLLLAQWGRCPLGCIADLDADGLVGINDLLDLLANWGPCP